jgi:hypothetical protein
MSSQEIEKASSEIRGHITKFLVTLDSRMDNQRLEEIVEANGTLGSENLGQLPERCVEDCLIWPVLETLGFEFIPRPYYRSGDENERPDFCIDNLAGTVIGENKSVNRFSEAKSDLELYLDSQHYEYGIATDGFRWGMHELEADSGGRAKLVDVIEEQDLVPAVQRIARDEGLVNYNEELQTEATVEGVLGNFCQTFNHYEIRRAIGGLTEFYDLYLEVIAGDGEYQNFELSLVDALDAPSGATTAEKLAFTTLFVDRLAFLKLLADRDLLREVVFHEQWQKHNQGLNRFRGSFYSQYLKPLFYDALSTPRQSRDDGLRGSLRNLYHLGGGLFSSILPDERDYDLPDDVMKVVLTRFVEAEQRTLINEALGGSLLQAYTEEYESRDIVGRIPQYYSTIVDAYAAEIEYVESQVERTLRSYENQESR